MMVLLGLLLLATVLEAYLVRSLPAKPLRVGLAVAVAALLLFSSTGLLLVRWPVWLGVWLLVWYRLVNVARVAKGRLPDVELRRVAPRTFVWFVGLQLVLAGFSWWLAEVEMLRHHISLVVPLLQFALALILLRATLRTWRRTKLPHHIAPRADNELPTLSVLIPARNETDDLEACLASLVASDYPKLEVIVLDDCSVTKRTPEIIRMFAHDGVRFVAGDVPDEKNWLAKNQAYDQLMQEASGEVLLFCGVDVRFERQTLRLLVETLLTRQKQMMSLLPLRAPEAQSSTSLIQPIRYFWELALPRRLFNRPPVLSTCWLITSEALHRLGGFKAVARKIVPEAYFARQLTVHDGYSFVRSNFALGLVSNKSVPEQRQTVVRTRYPQLHRRIELVVITALAELFFFIGPLVTLVLGLVLDAPYTLALILLVAAIYLALLVAYYHIAVRTKLNSPWLAWLLFPFAILSDVALVHVSMWKYEFSMVEWKGRNVCIPVMKAEPKHS